MLKMMTKIQRSIFTKICVNQARLIDLDNVKLPLNTVT